MNRPLEFAEYMASAAAHLLAALQIEDQARVRWDESGAGTPEFERWSRATETRTEAALALRSAVYEFKKRAGGAA